MKLLYFDIETTPVVSYVWQPYQTDIIEVVEDWKLLCFAYKWNDKRVKGVSLADVKNEKALVEHIWKLFDEADVICGHNSDSFDIKKSNAKFVEYGLAAPSFYKTIDTKKVAKKYFKFTRNKLDDIAQLFDIGSKINTGGFPLWRRCMAGEKKALREMLRYCKQDVLLLEQVHLKMRPFIQGGPNANLYNGTTHACVNCGSFATQKRGYSYTRVGKYQRIQCTSCGSWSTGEKIKGDKIELR